MNKKKTDDTAKNIIDLIQDDEDVVKKESQNVFFSITKKIDNYVDFSKGSGSMKEWVELNRMIYGRKFSYNDSKIKMMLGNEDKKNLKLNKDGFLEKAPRIYLNQYQNDKARDKSLIKCRQSEFTENEINENIYLCVSRPYTNIRHIFPTAGLALQIAKEKISPAIEKSPKIVSYLKRPFNLSSKSFENGSFYTIDSSWTDYQGRGPSSDKLTFDEYESQNPQIEDVFSESTSHSSLGKKVRISTPKFPNSGIDFMFNKGSGYQWFAMCSKCKREQILTFPDNLINFFDVGFIDIVSEKYMKKLNKVYIGCKFCGKYIDRTSNFYLNNTKWVPLRKHLITERSSYQVSYMMLPWKTGKEILYKYHTFKFLHQWWNEIMGFAYLDKDAQVTREIFEQCQDKSFVNTYQKLGNARNISVGIDWGMISWVVIRANGFLPDKKKSRVIYAERIDNESLEKNGYKEPQQTDHAKRVVDIIRFFGAAIIVNDANGIGIDRNSYLVRKFPTRAYGAFYDTDERKKQKRKKNLIQPNWNESQKTVTVSRVGEFKIMLQEYEELKTVIPRLDPVIEEFIQHHANLVIEKYEDENTGAIYEVIGKTGQDHFCLKSGTMIITNYGEKSIESINSGDFVLTRFGYKKVIKRHENGIKETKKYKIGNSSLISTKRHEIWTINGFKQIATLTHKDICFIIPLESRILCNILQKIKLSIKELLLENIQMQKKEVVEYIMFRVQQILKKELEDCTKKYGKIDSEKYRKVLLSIIKIIILKTILLKILNVFLTNNIEKFMVKNILKIIEIKFWKILKKQGIFQRIGIKQKKGNFIIKNLQKILEKLFMKKFVKFVKQVLKHFLKKLKFVVINVILKKEEFLELIMKKDFVLNVKKNLLSTNILKQNLVEKNAFQKVYDLEVEEVHEYFANGILVSNSHADLYSNVGFKKIVNTDREVNAGSINPNSGISQDILEQIRKIEESY